jgi:DNA-directed RNA polymerase beta' subunit
MSDQKQKKRECRLTSFISEFIWTTRWITKKFIWNNRVCSCGETDIGVEEFYEASKVCQFCITSTSEPIHGKTHIFWNRTTHGKFFSPLEMTAFNYNPGFCDCGRTSTEVPLTSPIFCGYCGVQVTINKFSRRHKIGYIPLSVPLAHVWYYHFPPRPIRCITGFSNRIIFLIRRSERVVSSGVSIPYNRKSKFYFSSEFVPATRATNKNVLSYSPIGAKSNVHILIPHYPNKKKNKRIFKGKNNVENNSSKYTSIQNSVFLIETKILFFPWYCITRDTLFFSSWMKRKKRKQGTNILGLTRIEYFFTPKLKHVDYLIGMYRTPNSFKNISSEIQIPISIKLGVHIRREWRSKSSNRTGNTVIRYNLKIRDTLAWIIVTRCRMNNLRIFIEVLENRDMLTNSQKQRCLNIVNTKNKILLRMRRSIEIQNAGIPPKWIILLCVPVLPPDLRPIMKTENEKVILVDDMNKLYQRLIQINLRIAKVQRLQRHTHTTKNKDNYYSYYERTLHEALESLIKTRKNKQTSTRRVYKSLADTLGGKQGRFRNHILGKRVDYSRRSVIVSGPYLDLHQCGLPRVIVKVLFQPFIIRFLLKKKVSTRFWARQFIEQISEEIWIRRKNILDDIPVILNRAPTLHRLGFQAFQPRIVRGLAIAVNPLICSGFNADFDGDQIAVHVPLSINRANEAFRLITPGSYFFFPSTGDLAFVASQDIVIGSYLMTTTYDIPRVFRSILNIVTFTTYKRYTKKKYQNNINPIFFTREDRFQELLNGKVELHKYIWMYIPAYTLITPESTYIPFEVRFHKNGMIQRLSTWYTNIHIPMIKFVRTTVGRILFSSIVIPIYRTFHYKHH